ncbi:hypothetical protein ZWY2020_009553 [Hordeum vulgare]|nr:hypothetical protein ZWY2020_009553 [Hordeum vulgare]
MFSTGPLSVAFSTTVAVTRGAAIEPEAVRWGADYLAKAHALPDVLYVNVGDGDSDHACWERPKDMDTPQRAYMVNATHPGSDVATETAAVLAAACMS